MKKSILVILFVMPITTFINAGEANTSDYLKNATAFHYGPGPSYQESHEEIENDLKEDIEEQKTNKQSQPAEHHSPAKF